MDEPVMSEAVMELGVLKALANSVNRHYSLRQAGVTVEYFYFDGRCQQNTADPPPGFTGVVGRVKLANDQSAQLRLGRDRLVYLNAASRSHIWESAKSIIEDRLKGLNLFPTTQDRTTTKGTSMKENNAAAILRDDTCTISVQFVEGEKLYTYVSTIPDLKEGDYVVVPVNTEDKFSMAKVVSIDDDVNIEPSSSQRYKFVVDKVNIERYKTLLEENRQIEKALAENYRNNARQAFKSAMLGGNPELLALVNKKASG